MGTTNDSAVAKAVNCGSDSGNQTSVLENSFLAAAAAIATFIPFIPLMTWLLTKSVVQVLRCFSKNSMWAAVFNSILWMIFTVTSKEKLDNVELIVAYPIILTTAYVSLIILYGDERKVKQAAFLTAIVVLSLLFVFIALRFTIEMPQAGHIFLGAVGCVAYIWANVHIIFDLNEATSFFDLGIAALSVLPNLIVNGATLYFYLKNSRHNPILLATSVIGCVMGIAELTAIPTMGFKKNWFRVPALPGNNGHNPGNP